MKYLSGDFLAEYNQTLDSLEKEQKSIDEKYRTKIDSLVNREISRLDSVIPNPFSPGQQVRIIETGQVGTVVDCPINFTVDMEDYDYGDSEKFGPSKFYRIKNESDEEVATCEGVMRMVNVILQASPIENDWGIEDKIVKFWLDEVEDFKEI